MVLVENLILPCEDSIFSSYWRKEDLTERASKCSSQMSSILLLLYGHWEREEDSFGAFQPLYQMDCNLQSCVKTSLQSLLNHSQNIPLPILKIHCDAIFQPAIPQTWSGMSLRYSVKLRRSNRSKKCISEC